MRSTSISSLPNSYLLTKPGMKNKNVKRGQRLHAGGDQAVTGGGSGAVPNGGWGYEERHSPEGSSWRRNIHSARTYGIDDLWLELLMNKIFWGVLRIEWMKQISGRGWPSRRWRYQCVWLSDDEGGDEGGRCARRTASVSESLVLYICAPAYIFPFWPSTATPPFPSPHTPHHTCSLCAPWWWTTRSGCRKASAWQIKGRYKGSSARRGIWNAGCRWVWEDRHRSQWMLCIIVPGARGQEERQAWETVDLEMQPPTSEV